jgi:hypothetical protein
LDEEKIISMVYGVKDPDTWKENQEKKTNEFVNKLANE